MTIRFSVKYATMIVAVGALAASAAYFGGTHTASLISERGAMLALIGTVCAIMIGFRGPIANGWNTLTRDAAPHDMAPREALNTDASSDPFDEDDAQSAGKQTASNLDSLKFALRDRPLRRQARLLIAGDDAVIARLMPELVKHGWLSTGHALLLWGKTDTDGQPDNTWLLEVYKLRRRRPVDAVILTLDGTAGTAVPRRGSNANSVILAHIADVLHWSAPVYALDVAQTDDFNDGRTAPLGCEFAPMRQASLSDTLVAKAQNMFGKKDDAAVTASANIAGPLSASFDPVLRLIGQASDAPKSQANVQPSDVSLQRYLERVTALRLKLQQISTGADGDAQARQLAQALFQGKSSELADTQAYAQLIAASLGAQWSGMGDALFVRPIAQATQIVLQPAQASMNDVWHQSIVVAWNKSFAGRYPFDNTDNDASIPELARFIRPQGGLISSLLSTQLTGVLELQGDQWVEVNSRGGALQFDPAFLTAVNMLQRVASHLMPQGEPLYRFDFKPIPTPGITDTLPTLDAQKLHYFNQRERWQGLQWPSNDPQVAGTRLQWQTETAGTSKSFEFTGRWALIRMLERAKVEPIDNATFQLAWQAAPDTSMARMAAQSVPSASNAQTAPHTAADDWSGSAHDASPDHASLDSLVTQAPLTAAPANLTYPLSYFMRSDVGKGPLELLALKGFKMPNRMFIGNKRVVPESKGASPPPLPKAALEAAKQAATPLPSGDPGHSL
jgi:hypothetical protein